METTVRTRSICVRAGRQREIEIDQTTRAERDRARKKKKKKLLERGVALPVVTGKPPRQSPPCANSIAVAQLIRRPVKRKRALGAQHCSRSEPTDHRSRKNLFPPATVTCTRRTWLARLRYSSILRSLSLSLSPRVRDIADTFLAKERERELRWRLQSNCASNTVDEKNKKKNGINNRRNRVTRRAVGNADAGLSMSDIRNPTFARQLNEGKNWLRRSRRRVTAAAPCI